MIEVEQKFILTEKDIERLTAGADFLGEKIFTDIYYDTAEFALTKNDMWLRDRDGGYELKIPMRAVAESPTQQYNEIEGEEKIRELFALPPKADFVTDIAEFGYAPFCTLITTRKKYAKSGFMIDLDLVEVGDFVYNIAKIELLVKEKKDIPEAIGKIEEFATKNGLKISNVRGKVLEYLLRKKPAHYQALVTAGVVKNK